MEAVGLRILFITDSDRLSLVGLQVDDISTKLRQKVQRNCINEVNQALSRCFFSAFSENLGRGISTIFRLSIIQQLVGLMSFTLNLKNKIAKFP